jgi:hypothetical protein
MRLILPSSWQQRERDDMLPTKNGVTPELRAVATIPPGQVAGALIAGGGGR